MKDDVRKARLAKLLGMELPVEPTPQERQLAGTISREAEAVLLYTENRNAFQVKNCKVCDEKFAVNRSSIGYCSDICRGDALGAMGIAWDPNARTLADRWSVRTGGPEPLVIREKVLNLIPEPQVIHPPTELTVPQSQSVDELLAGLLE